SRQGASEAGTPASNGAMLHLSGTPRQAYMSEHAAKRHAAARAGGGGGRIVLARNRGPSPALKRWVVCWLTRPAGVERAFCFNASRQKRAPLTEQIGCSASAGSCRTPWDRTPTES